MSDYDLIMATEKNEPLRITSWEPAAMPWSFHAGDGAQVFGIHADGSTEGDLDEAIRAIEQASGSDPMPYTGLPLLYALRKARDGAKG